MFVSRDRWRLASDAVQERAVAVDQLAIRVDLAPRAEVADHVPVECRPVGAAALRKRAAEREVHRPADLLVEEDVAGEHANGVVQPESHLAETPRTLVDADHLFEEILPAGRARLHHLAAAKAQADVVDLPAAEHRRVGEPDLALGARFVRRSEDLAVGEVLVSVGGDPGAAADSDREIGPLRDHPQLALAGEELRHPYEPPGELVPASDGLG